MLPVTPSYTIMPSVVLADTKTAMTILPLERAYIFADEQEFTVKIIPVDADESYYNPYAYTLLNVCAKEGAVAFDFEFSGEGEYTVELISNNTVTDSFTVYSLYKDLYSLTPFKGDLHSHSCRSDGKRDPAQQAGYYREQGYDFVALTDHNRYYSGGEIDDAYEGVNTGLTRIMGEEVHSPDSVVHIVHVGGRKSVADRYVRDRENYNAEIEEYLKKVPEDIPEKYKSRYAKAMWATDAIHEAGGIAIFPHPYWRPGGTKTYNICTEFAKILLKSGMFDAYEIAGAMTQPDLNCSVALWSEVRSEGYSIPAVGSSDAHNLEKSTTFPYNSTICFAKEKTNDAIVSAVKNGMCVAVESTGSDYTRQNRCYGSLRLVLYAQFLLKNYFPSLQRIASGAGIAMRAYLTEDIDASVIGSYTALADKFTDRFFGRAPAPLPTPTALKFEEKWRKVQLDGPRTRGSSVDATPAKTLI